MIQQPAFFGLQLVDWLTAALRKQQQHPDREDATEDGFVLHEPVQHKIDDGSEEQKQTESENADKPDSKDREETAGSDLNGNVMNGDNLRHIVTQICTLLLAVGTLKSTEERSSGINHFFKVSHANSPAVLEFG